jgi:hypothetical protein
MAPLAFLQKGKLVTPWGDGRWGAHPTDPAAIFANFVGQEHTVRVGKCAAIPCRERMFLLERSDPSPPPADHDVTSAAVLCQVLESRLHAQERRRPCHGRGPPLQAAHRLCRARGAAHGRGLDARGGQR